MTGSTIEPEPEVARLPADVGRAHAVGLGPQDVRRAQADAPAAGGRGGGEALGQAVVKPTVPAHRIQPGSASIGRLSPRATGGRRPVGSL